MRQPLLKEGETCWRKVRTDRVSFIIDAADYFAAAKDAIQQARQCVYLIGWEFDLDIRLRPDIADPEIPDQLRHFLQHVVEKRPDLKIFVLQWRGAMLFNITRQLGSYLLLKAQAKPQIHFRLDGKHPVGACHHQKIIVIDDVLAFCGGIDMTSGRWDDWHHRGERSARSGGGGGGSPMPWHDMTLALDGEAARNLGELARWRWKNAMGHDLPVPSVREPIWPDRLSPDLCGALVGIARSCPAYGGNEQIQEVEKLWCAAIKSARRRIYIENQFLSSGKIAAALQAKLEEAGGPEIVIILPFAAESWLESEAMDTRRSLILHNLRQSDSKGRLGVYQAVNAKGEHIYVHAKLLIVDDEFVRIGSSNMASRSLAMDSECDLALEASDQTELRDFLAGLRVRLMSEHLGIPVGTLEAGLKECGGSILAVIEKLRGTDGRTLKVLEAGEMTESERALAESCLLDPERPISISRRLADFAREELRRKRAVIVILGLAGAALSATTIARRRR